MLPDLKTGWSGGGEGEVVRVQKATGTERQLPIEVISLVLKGGS